MKLFGKIFLALFLLVGISGNLLAKEKPIYTGTFDNKAVSGYDTVAYFTEGKAVKGSPNIVSKYMGAVWQFSSAANKAKFDANPTQYAPQYGGYCSWAVSQNDTASADPTKWRIVDGKLYLNYDADVQKKWEKDIPGFIRKANANWPKVLDN
jgi:YHS domain-containing protein